MIVDFVSLIIKNVTRDKKMSNKRFKSDLVSVIIPTYNSEKFIKKTVWSALDQTYEKLEILIIDDCSKDNTRYVIEEISYQDDRVKGIYQKTNQGAAVARNTGIRNATGKYIAFLDSDDLWEAEKIQKQLDALRIGYPFVFTAYDYVDEKRNLIGEKTSIKTEVSYKDELTKTYISTPTVIYDREFFNDPQMPLRKTGQDYAFWLELLSRSKAYGIDEALVHVTRRAGSLSKSKFQSLVDVFEVQTKFEKIGKIKAGWNVFQYLLYAANKRFLRKMPGKVDR